MERYDIGQLKNLAIGRWIELLNIDPEFLDTKHHPCPKQCAPDAGGRDRFRALDDFYSSGAVVCNKCFNSRNGDGLATYAWFNDCSFSEALEAVATKLGIAPNKVSQGKGNGKASGKKANEKPRKSLDELFTVQPWNESLANIFCVRKGGIVASSLVAVGAVITKHFDSIVMSLPIRNATVEIIGYTSANVSGGKLIIPGESPDAQSEVVSWKNSIPTKTKGIVATANLFDPAARSSITRIYKTEGPSDLLAIIPFLQPGEGAFCNPSGAGENPDNFAWLAEWLAGKQIIVIHDRDDAGLTGSLGDSRKNRLGWATWAAAFAKEVRNIELPYPLVEAHGKDFRDWVRDGGNALALKKLIDESSPIGQLQLRAEIELTCDESVTVNKVIDQLAKRGDVYQRNSQLVQALVQPTQFGDGESLMIREIPFPAIRTVISGTCSFYSVDKEGEKQYRAVPNSIPSQVACHGTYQGVPSLAGVTEYPIMRQDGSICSAQGYDQATKTIVRCTADLSKIIERPTRDDALQAVERIADLVCDFPFSKAEYRSAWIASVLTAVARTAIRGPVPLMLYDASSSGSGKSRLADIAAIALTGRPMPRTPWPSKDEEVRKSITATLRGGQPLLCFDNCKTTLGGQSIEALGTAETWSDRILGESRNTSELAIRTVFFFTANNASLTEDASRRMCYLRMEPEDERPESRSGFKYENLLKFVEDNRGQIIADIVTILRAYQIAGCPKVDGIPWGSYENWCKMVRDPLVWLNMADPRQGTVELSNAAMAEDSNAMLIQALEESEIPSTGWTSKEIIESATSYDSYVGAYRNKNLRDAVLALIEEKKLNTKTLSREMKKIDGKIFNGKKIFSHYDSHKKIYRWKISVLSAESAGMRVDAGTILYQYIEEEEDNIICHNRGDGRKTSPQLPAYPQNHCQPSCKQENWFEKIENGKIISRCKICDRFIGQRPNEEEFLNG